MNAKEELQKVLNFQEQKGRSLVCAEITHEGEWGEDASKIELKVGHTKEQAEAFFNQLNFKYNNGYGTQELYGTVWLTHDVWLSRWEYDGSEGWQVNKRPIIPDYLKGETAPPVDDEEQRTANYAEWVELTRAIQGMEQRIHNGRMIERDEM
jgi:hypothetical protein